MKSLKDFRMRMAGLLAMVLVLAAPFSCFAKQPTFDDVPTSHWAFSFIEKAYNDSAVNGTYHNGDVRLYSPADTLTVAQWTTMVTKAYWSDEVNAQPAGEHWYSRNEVVANNHMLLDDVKNTTMQKELNRYDMAVMVVNTMIAAGADVPAYSVEILEYCEAHIADWDKIPEDYRPYVGLVFDMDIIHGVDKNGTFYGEGLFNRAQAAVVYCRMAEIVAPGENQYTPNAPSYEEPEIPKAPETNNKPAEGACCPADTNSDGIVTEEEVVAKLAELEKKYPNGYKYDAQDAYYTSNFPPHSGGKGCAKAAFFLSDQVFGNMPAKVHHDLSKIKPGDVINDIEGHHFNIVMARSTGGDFGFIYKSADGSNSGELTWGYDSFIPDIAEVEIYTRYGN